MKKSKKSAQTRDMGGKGSRGGVGASREHLAVNLQVARAMLGWSQEQLGLKCGLKRTYIGTIERREINPGIDNLDKIADGIGVDSHVLILDPEQAHPLMYKSFNGR